MEINTQLVAIILLVVLYLVGFWLVASGRSGSLSGIPVVLLFIASLIYLGVSSWRLLLMMLGSCVLILSGTAFFDIALKARRLPERPEYSKVFRLESWSESQREAKPLLKQIFPFPLLRGRG